MKRVFCFVLLRSSSLSLFWRLPSKDLFWYSCSMWLTNPNGIVFLRHLLRMSLISPSVISLVRFRFYFSLIFYWSFKWHPSLQLQVSVVRHVQHRNRLLLIIATYVILCDIFLPFKQARALLSCIILDSHLSMTDSSNYAPRCLYSCHGLIFWLLSIWECDIAAPINNYFVFWTFTDKSHLYEFSHDVFHIFFMISNY